MGMHTLTSTLTKILDIPWLEGVQFIWQGGEPLESGLEFFEHAVEIQNNSNKNGVKIKNSLQTNGTLLTDEALDFFASNNFGIGISLDGPKHIHDAQRIHRNTRIGTYDEVMSAIQKLRNRGCKVGIIAVVTKLGLEQPTELFTFLTGVADGVKFRPMLPWGSGISAKDDYGITAEEYSCFLEALFPLWLQCPPEKEISPFRDVYYGLSLNKPITCASKKCHESYLYVAPSGDVYPCSELEGETSLSYGNINQDPVASIFASPNRKKIIEARESIRGCSLCEYYDFCNSGCLVSTFMIDRRLDHKDYWCASHLKLFELVRKVQAASISLIEQAKSTTG